MLASRECARVCVCVCVYLVPVHPHVRQPQGIMGHGVMAAWRAIGPPFPEDMANPGARDDEELTAAHPDLSETARRCSSSCSPSSHHFLSMR